MFEKIKNFFNRAVRKLWKIIRKVISSALETFLAELIEYAKEIVTGLINSDLSNDAKRKMAFGLIRDKAVSKGIFYKDHFVNIIIELSLAAVKKELNG